jgi:HAD superfamily hydrolase (TIGR01484 family)
MAIVTGRPAGWCDHIARFWPVDAVIGENGAFYFYHDGKKLRQRFLQSVEERKRSRERLNTLRETILKAVPGTAVASDQEYRESDLAIDFCEDVPALPRSEILRIKTLFDQAGARAKISSIHVNGWFGEFDKLTMVKRWALEQLGLNLEQERDQCVFCGDSPNDEPMFDFFPLSFGMANLVPFSSMLSRRPAFICEQECGAGFCQVVEKILEARRVASTA